MPNVNLHAHTEGSFLDGEARPERIFQRADELGMDYVAFTDHGECNQHLKGFKLAQQYGKGFIPGMEGYWLSAASLAKAREDKRYPNPSHICLLAVTNTGLSNLWALSSEAYNEAHFYYKPIATPELLRKYSEGLYASDGCMMTEFAEAVQHDRDDEARQILGQLRDIFKDRFYMELHTWQYMELPEIPPEPKVPEMLPDGRPIFMAPGEAQELIDTQAGARAKAKEMHRLNAAMTKINQAKVRLAHELGVPLVIVNDSHHAYPQDWYNRELVWQFNTGKNPDQVGTVAQKADHLMGDEELYLYMRRHGISDAVIAEAIKNSQEIAASCKVQIKPTLALPKMAPTDEDDFRNLVKACEEGFKRYVVDEGLNEESYMLRLKEELGLIAEKNFAGYFNMVRDYTMAYRTGSWSQYVKKNTDPEPMLLGPGRGSVGGSLVGYLCGIHVIDPLKYGTLFSRFLSPGRQGLPDIDLDLPRSQRPDALKYMAARHGHENVCAIGTLNRLGPKQALRDLGRAMQIPYTDINIMAEYIAEVEAMRDPDNPDQEELTWAELVERKGGELRPWAQKYPELFEKVQQFIDPRGLIRHSGVHAAGILVSGTPLLGAIPMRRTKNKVITTQFDMWEVEELGGVKDDKLGINHLDTLSVARKMIYERHGVWIDYDRSGLSVPAGCTNVLKFGDEQFNDPAIYPQIDAGQTTGIFQVGTANCTETAIKFQPRSLADVANLTSIIRPGVKDAGLLEVYLRRHHGQERVVYDHPLMEKFVGPSWVTDTYGILVYQEQLMEACRVLAGFTPDECDGVRGAVGKKQMDKLVAYKQKFIQGCQDNPDYALGCGDPVNQTLNEKKEIQVAHHIWASIEASGRYAFNWSHAIGYAMIAVWEIWTKHHYPQEFLVALMATDADNINRYIREARRREITILPPDINKSDRKFTIEGDAIRYGLDTVRGVGSVASLHIDAGRPYRSFEDYLERAGKGADKTAVYNLVLIGAFDEMGTRDEMLDRLETHRASEGLATSTLTNPEKLSTAIERRLASGNYQLDRPDFSDPTVLYEIEKELVGTYVTVDPLEPYIKSLDACAIRDPMEINKFAPKAEFIIGGQLTAIRPTVTKKGRNPGQAMAHITVMWNETEFRIVVFPEAWARTKLLLEVGKPVACKVQRLDQGCCLQTVERLDRLWARNGLA